MNRKNQRGAAALMIVLFLLVVGSAAVVTALSTSGSDTGDTAYQHNSVAALGLAESGLERVAGRLSTGTACVSLGTEGPYSLGQGTFSIVTPAPYIDIGWCRVRVSGTVGTIKRTVDAWLSGDSIALEQQNNASGTTNSLTFAHNVAGTNRVLLVGVTVDQAGTAVNWVQYAGVNLIRQASIGTGGRPRAEIWSLVNPPVNTNNVVVSLTGNDQVIAGAMSFTGVNLTTPFDAAGQTSSGNSSTPAITITPATNNAWIMDVMSANNSVTATMGTVTPAAAGAAHTQQWNLSVGVSIRGAASLYGPINPAAATTTRWTLVSAQRWTMAAVALRSSGSAQIVRWSEVVN